MSVVFKQSEHALRDAAVGTTLSFLTGVIHSHNFLECFAPDPTPNSVPWW